MPWWLSIVHMLLVPFIALRVRQQRTSELVRGQMDMCFMQWSIDTHVVFRIHVHVVLIVLFHDQMHVLVCSTVHVV